MPVEKWTPQRRRQLTRDALIDAAAQVFARRGFHGASLDEIAETAGFTRGAIYKNFGDKEDLFFAVFDRSIQMNLAAFGDRLEGRPTIAEMDAAELAAIWHETRARNADLFALELEFKLYAFRNPEVRERFAAHQKGLREMVVRFIEEQAVAGGFELVIPVERMAAIVVAASEGFLEAGYLDPELPDLFGAFLELFMPAIIASPARSRRAPARKAAKKTAPR